MSKMYIPNHKYPAKHVAVSASQNISKSQKRADKKQAKSFAYYSKNGLMPSIKFSRTVDSIIKGYDENKAVFPVYKEVPLFAVTTIAALESKMIVSVTGNNDVGAIVDELKKYYRCQNKTEYLNLKWVPELGNIDEYEISHKTVTNKDLIKNRKKITISNSLSRLAQSLELEDDDAFIFVTGDVIFYDYQRVSHDKDLINHSLIIDLNGKETINPPIPRNYYHRLITGQGNTVHFKEPNVWIIGSEFNLGVSDTTYKNAQKGGFGIKTFLNMAGKNMIKNPHKLTIWDLISLAGAGAKESIHFVLKRGLKKTYIPKYYQTDLESIAKFLNMSPIRIKAEHDDYLRLKDVDGMHDYVFIRHLLEGHIDDVLPENIAENVKGFADYLKSTGITKEIMMIDNFPFWINKKIKRIQKILGDSYKLEEVFDDNGEFIAQPGKDEGLEKAVERSKRDLEKYYKRKYL